MTRNKKKKQRMHATYQERGQSTDKKGISRHLGK
jgi:hypothetical protein